MKIQLLIEVETPRVARHAAEVRTDLRQLLLDSLQLSLQRHPDFLLRTEVKTGAGSASALLTKAEVAQLTKMSLRNVERCVKAKKLAEPIRIAAPHCANGSPRWFPEDIPSSRPLPVEFK